MDVSYYPGCSLDGTAKEYGEATEAICKTLGIKLMELNDWNCCGSSSAHATSDLLAVALPARNLEIADKVGLDLVVPEGALITDWYHTFDVKLPEEERTPENEGDAVALDNRLLKGDSQI